jgi:hypothetical protein
MGSPTKLLSLIAIIVSLPLHSGNAQFLPVNGMNKCEATEVVLAEGFTGPALYANELRWLKGLTRVDGKLSSVIKDSIGGTVSGNFEFLVYAQSGILRKVAGAISYHFSVETKEGKYRYSFTDFVYHYYAQDRNYRVVKTGKTKPLEEVEAPGWQKLWTDHRKTVSARVHNQIDELKQKILETPKQAAGKPEVKKVDW